MGDASSGAALAAATPARSCILSGSSGICSGDSLAAVRSCALTLSTSISKPTSSSSGLRASASSEMGSLRVSFKHSDGWYACMTAVHPRDWIYSAERGRTAGQPMKITCKINQRHLLPTEDAVYLLPLSEYLWIKQIRNIVLSQVATLDCTTTVLPRADSTRRNPPKFLSDFSHPSTR
jgi:hypothetical protein